MNEGGARRVIPVVLVLIVIAVAIAAVVSVGQSLFNGGNSQPEINQGKESLVNTSEDRSVRMIVRGPIVADEEFNSYVISASSTQRTMTTYVGYLDRQVETKQLLNNIPSYEEFVYALDRALMMEGNELTGDANDLRGICATGRVYQFETLRNGNVIKSLWTSTCKGSKGSLKASQSQLQSLFQAQIPDFEKMLSKIKV